MKENIKKTIEEIKRSLPSGMTIERWNKYGKDRIYVEHDTGHNMVARGFLNVENNIISSDKRNLDMRKNGVKEIYEALAGIEIVEETEVTEVAAEAEAEAEAEKEVEEVETEIMECIKELIHSATDENCIAIYDIHWTHEGVTYYGTLTVTATGNGLCRVTAEDNKWHKVSYNEMLNADRVVDLIEELTEVDFDTTAGMDI